MRAPLTNKRPKPTRPQMGGYGLPKSKKGLLPWKWAEDRLKKSKQYWIATTRPDGRPHVMVVWALWMNGVLYFSTGRESRKAKNLAANPHCTMCNENAAEAVILEGVVETERNVERIRDFVKLYEKKYKWKLGEMGENMIALKEPVFYLKPRVAFGFWKRSSRLVQRAGCSTKNTEKHSAAEIANAAEKTGNAFLCDLGVLGG